MHYYRIKLLVLIRILLPLLLFTSFNLYAYEEWVFKAHSSLGNKISDSLFVLKNQNSIYISVCTFFEEIGAKTLSKGDGKSCIIKNFDEKTLIIKNDSLFVDGSNYAGLVFNNDEYFIDTKYLINLGITVESDYENVNLIISAEKGLPIDNKMRLLSQSVTLENKKSSKIKNNRKVFQANRVLIEANRSNLNSFQSLTTNFDLLGGELSSFSCNDNCEDTITWFKEAKFKDYRYNLLVGDNNNFYFPNEVDILENSVEFNLYKTQSKRKLNINNYQNNEYLIYKNNILIKKGRGSLEDIYLDLTDQNYNSDYKVKVVDNRGNINEIDILVGSNLYKMGDFEFTSINNDDSYHYNNLQFGVTDNLNLIYANIDTNENKSQMYGAKFGAKNIKFDIYKLDKENSFKEYEELSLNFKNLTYNFYHFFDSDDLNSDKQINTLTFSNNYGLFQSRYIVEDHKFITKQYIVGKQFKSLFASVEKVIRYDNSSYEKIDFSSQYYDLKYSFGIKTPWDNLEKYILTRYEQKRSIYSLFLSESNNQNSYNFRYDYKFKNWQFYTSARKETEEEFLIGGIWGIFPSHPQVELTEIPKTLVLVNVFLDENNNGKKDENESHLSGISGFLDTKRNLAFSDDSGKMVFSSTSSSKNIHFDIEESSLKHLYMTTARDSVYFDIIPRKVNVFDFPIRLNGIILIDCASLKNISNLALYDDSNNLIKKLNKCREHLIVDELKAGEFILKYDVGSSKRSDKINLNKDNMYYSEVIISVI